MGRQCSYLLPTLIHHNISISSALPLEDFHNTALSQFPSFPIYSTGLSNRYVFFPTILFALSVAFPWVSPSPNISMWIFCKYELKFLDCKSQIYIFIATSKGSLTNKIKLNSLSFVPKCLSFSECLFFYDRTLRVIFYSFFSICTVTNIF